MEIWEKIEGYPEFEVSNLGRVKDCLKNKIRPLYKNVDGYMVVNIGRGKERKQFRVNRLVAMAFISNPENKPNVNHINSVRSDDRVENLEWCTQLENVRHSMESGNRNKYTNGISNGILNIIKYMYNDLGYSKIKISKTFKIERRKISRLLLTDKI